MATKPNDGHLDWINDNDGAKYAAPSSAKRLQGWLANEKPPFQYFNWAWRLIDRWLQWAEAQSDEDAAAIAAEQAARAAGDARTQRNYTENLSVQPSDLNGHVILTNYGATGQVNLQLPAGAAGYRLIVAVATAQYLRLTADGTQRFRFGAHTSAAGGYIRTNVVGRMWMVQFITGLNQWIVVPMSDPATFSILADQ